jgi:hypothetical protein
MGLVTDSVVDPSSEAADHLPAAPEDVAAVMAGTPAVGRGGDVVTSRAGGAPAPRRAVDAPPARTVQGAGDKPSLGTSFATRNPEGLAFAAPVQGPG